LCDGFSIFCCDSTFGNVLIFCRALQHMENLGFKGGFVLVHDFMPDTSQKMPFSAVKDFQQFILRSGKNKLTMVS
jgi:hypothetical protein